MNHKLTKMIRLSLFSFSLFLIPNTVMAITETEVNDSFEEANNVSVNTIIDGALESYNDADHYKFDIPSKGYFRFVMNRSPRPRHYISIYDENYNELWESPSLSDEEIVESPEIEVDGGPLYVKISGSQTDDYRFKINTLLPDMDESESQVQEEDSDSLREESELEKDQRRREEQKQEDASLLSGEALEGAEGLDSVLFGSRKGVNSTAADSSDLSEEDKEPSTESIVDNPESDNNNRIAEDTETHPAPDFSVSLLDRISYLESQLGKDSESDTSIMKRMAALEEYVGVKNEQGMSLIDRLTEVEGILGISFPIEDKDIPDEESTPEPIDESMGDSMKEKKDEDSTLFGIEKDTELPDNNSATDDSQNVIDATNLEDVRAYTDNYFAATMKGATYEAFKSYTDQGEQIVSIPFDNDWGYRWGQFTEKHGEVKEAIVDQADKTEDGFSAHIILTGEDGGQMTLTIYYDKTLRPISTSINDYSEDTQETSTLFSGPEQKKTEEVQETEVYDDPMNQEEDDAEYDSESYPETSFDDSAYEETAYYQDVSELSDEDIDEIHKMSLGVFDEEVLNILDATESNVEITSLVPVRIWLLASDAENILYDVYRLEVRTSNGTVKRYYLTIEYMYAGYTVKDHKWTYPYIPISEGKLIEVDNGYYIWGFTSLKNAKKALVDDYPDKDAIFTYKKLKTKEESTEDLLSNDENEDDVDIVDETVEETLKSADEAVKHPEYAWVDDESDLSIMSYDEYTEAPVDTKVKIETYVQAKQSWWENKATLYTADKDGAYFIYSAACSQEDYDKLVEGQKIIVTGYKAEWGGEIEIADATIEIVDGNYISEARDVTSLLGTEELTDCMNQKVEFKGLTLEPMKDANGNDASFIYNWDGSGQEGDDLYFSASMNDETYLFVVESYLCDETTEVYQAVKSLKIGDVVDLEGFLYWYEGPQPHITKVNVTS